MRLLMTIILLASASISCYATSDSKSIEYISTSGLQKSLIVEGKAFNHKVLFGHHSYEAYTCDENDDFYCLISTPLSFAVKKDDLNRGDLWKKNDIEFKLSDIKTVQFLGKKMMIHYITSSQKHGNYLFLYTKETGLIGYRYEYDGASEFYLISGNCGIAKN